MAGWRTFFLLISVLFLGCGDGSEAGEAVRSGRQNHWINEEPIGSGAGPVDEAMLDAGLEDPTRWLLYGGNYANYRHSPITELTPEAVPDLRVAWTFPTGTDGQFEVSPVIYDEIGRASCRERV